MNAIYPELEGDFNNHICRNIFKELAKIRVKKVYGSKKKIMGILVHYKENFHDTNTHLIYRIIQLKKKERNEKI
jgi:hypothetical protein